MTSHKHSHDTGRAPLRLRPLPRPSRPSAPDSADEPGLDPAADDASAKDAASAAQPDEDAEASADDPGWIHEWERPETGV